jgi:allantoate deiminase
MELDLFTDRILTRCVELARFSEAPDRLTRTFLRPPMRQAHAALTGWMQAAGLEVRLDPMGNLIGRKKARRPDARTFLVGSHADTVPDAGKYDGILGVLLGVAAAEALAGDEFDLHLEIIAFSEEEGIRFRAPYLGSSAAAGLFDRALLEEKDADGISLKQAMLDFGLDPAAIPKAAYMSGSVAGYFEAHIEQGPVLEAMDLSLAVLDGIAGQSRRRLTFSGQAGHAGALPMSRRRDALTAAAEFVVLLEKMAQSVPGTRATVGRIEVFPGAVNVVPGKARLTMDTRHAVDSVRVEFLNQALGHARAIAAKRKVGFAAEEMSDQRAVACDLKLVRRLERCLSAAGHRPQHMTSGAGHDAAVMSHICPMAMLFLRSPGGISHHPAESVRKQDVQAALDVTIRFLRKSLDLTACAEEDAASSETELIEPAAEAPAKGTGGEGKER